MHSKSNSSAFKNRFVFGDHLFNSVLFYFFCAWKSVHHTPPPNVETINHYVAHFIGLRNAKSNQIQQVSLLIHTFETVHKRMVAVFKVASNRQKQKRVT